MLAKTKNILFFFLLAPLKVQRKKVYYLYIYIVQIVLLCIKFRHYNIDTIPTSLKLLKWQCCKML